MYAVAGSEHLIVAPGPSFPPALLLLSDSALPLGSFAFSSGLESYFVHHNVSTNKFHQHNNNTRSSETSSHDDHISTFLSLSLHSVASSMLPYLTAAYTQPSRLHTLDNDLDASISCTVTRRASIAQGRALLGVWEKAFKSHQEAATRDAQVQQAEDAITQSRTALDDFSTALKVPFNGDFTTAPPPVNGHLAPLFALVCHSLSLSLADTTWIFLFNHARAVLSAAVRAGVMGPYQSQSVLASGWLKDLLALGVRRGAETAVEDAGQCVPMMDVWSGRHELLYTRIFNS